MITATLLLLSLTASEPVAAKAKPAKVAKAYCEDALSKAVEYEDSEVVLPRSIELCERWYAQHASEAELEALVCMAQASSRTAWEACRAPVAPPEPTLPRPAIQLEVQRLDRGPLETSELLRALVEGGELEGVFGSVETESEGVAADAVGVYSFGSPRSGVGGTGYHGPRPTTDMTPGTPTVVGALEVEDVQAATLRHSAAIRYCYQRELVSKPDLSGELVVKFVIAVDGSVSTASIKSSTLGDTIVENCVTSRFLRFQFPEPPGGGVVVVSYPLRFQPGEEPPTPPSGAPPDEKSE
jgi:hypothetical protein